MINKYLKYLLIFLAVVLLIGLFLFLYSLLCWSGDFTIRTPQASIKAIEAGNGFVKIAHTGGDNLYLDYVKIAISQDNTEIIYEKASSNNDIFVVTDILNLSTDGIALNASKLNYSGRYVRTSGSGSTNGPISITLTDISSDKVIDVARISGNGISILG